MIKTYVMVWNNVFPNLQSIENQITNYSVINSDAPENKSWHNLGMIWYYKQMQFALNDFIENTQDNIFCWLAADVKSDSFNQIYKKAEEVLSIENNSIYGPHATHEAWSDANCSIANYMDKMKYACQTDGAFFFIKRDVASVLRDVMNYIDEKEDLSSMKSGWGLDYIHSSIAIYLGKYIVRDSDIIVDHPQGSSYDHGKAGQEMGAVINRFLEYCSNNNLDSDRMGKIIDKIGRRMGGDQKCMKLSAFYETENNIPYTIVSIDDKRINNKHRIKSILGEDNEIEVKSLNANDDEQLNEFLKSNEGFWFSWEDFKIGEVGCFASHYNIWKYIVENSLDYILVFEDDAWLDEDFLFKFNNLIGKIPEDFDVFSVYVDPNQYDRYSKEKHLINDEISRAYQDWSTLCYVVSIRGAEKMMDYVSKYGMNEPADWFMFRNTPAKNFNVYTMTPKPGSPLSIKDDTGSTVQQTKFLKKETIMMNKFQKFMDVYGKSEYSQNKQDLFALFVHGENPGYFVEFGACDGIHLSNTYLLEKNHGWTGILSEPAPSYYKDLLLNRSCHSDPLCVADETGKTMKFVEVDYNNDKGLSGLEEFVFQDHHSNTRKEHSITYDVDTISLKDLLDKYDAPDSIDFLSIDTEGSEYSILEAYDFSRHFKAIAVEHNNTENREKIYSLLTSQGYDRVLLEFSAWDDWYIKRDLLDETE